MPADQYRGDRVVQRRHDETADIAEETVNARHVIPRTMFYALTASIVIEFLMYVVYVLAIKDQDAVQVVATEQPATSLGPGAGDAGDYSVVVTNSLGTATSVAAALTVEIGRAHV